MKIVALDIGDRWTGVAMSDLEVLFAHPYTTVETTELIPFLSQAIQTHDITTIVVGYPQTLQGKESDQTRKTISFMETLQKTFPNITWDLWDERLSSKFADSSIFKKKKNLSPKEQQAEKLKGHARAAAFVLDAYLERLRHARN